MDAVTESELKAEARDLMSKIQKLDTFIGGSIHWDTLPAGDQELLSKQRTFMWHYYNILIQRINRFG